MRILDQLIKIPGFLGAWRKFPLGSVDTRVHYDVWSRPHYAYGLHAAADLAAALGIKEIAAIEFGVAGGRGLLALEDAAEQIEKASGVSIKIMGFDAGVGMPDPLDYRDLPHVWGKGFYEMDVPALKKRLRRAELILGDVGESVRALVRGRTTPPIGFISFDLDYYSSTKKAFEILDVPAEFRLPRIFAYFDDILWPERACHNPYTGELLAINEFNCDHKMMKICQIPHLRWMRPRAAAWNEQIYVVHDFEHPLYTRNITAEGADARQLRL
jgi:hypothetical protein